MREQVPKAFVREPERIINPEWSLREMVLELAREGQEGINPGALKVCAEIIKKGHRVDPFLIPGSEVLFLLNLDMQNIWASKIWSLYARVCGEDLIKFMAVVRACQLGGLGGATLEKVHRAVERGSNDGTLDLDKILKAVQKKLPGFGAKEILKD